VDTLVNMALAMQYL